MAFKINVAHKGRTFKAETDNETLIRMKIGEKVSGDMISDLLEGYSLEITGTSDISGLKGEVGGQLRKLLLKKGNLGMRATRPGGLRLKKSVRGEEISDKTSQINMIVLKEGSKKFDEICPVKVKEEKKAEVATAA